MNRYLRISGTTKFPQVNISWYVQYIYIYTCTIGTALVQTNNPNGLKQPVWDKKNRAKFILTHLEIGYKLTDCENQKMYSNFTIINSKNDKNVTAFFAFLSFGNQLQLYCLKDPELRQVK